jgi:hypothetical protein
MNETKVNRIDWHLVARDLANTIEERDIRIGILEAALRNIIDISDKAEQYYTRIGDRATRALLRAARISKVPGGTDQ